MSREPNRNGHQNASDHTDGREYVQGDGCANAAPVATGGRPSTTEANGRDTKGRFGAGNRAAKGNPHAAKVARLRAAMLNAVEPADVRDVVAGLLTQAKAGDIPAIKELLQRLLGPPVELDFVERMGTLEQRIAELDRRSSR